MSKSLVTAPGWAKASINLLMMSAKASKQRWLSLPDSLVATEAANRAKTDEERALNRIGVTKMQRLHALFQASREGETGKLLSILEAGVDVNGQTEYGITALHLAAWHDHSDCFRILYEFGADVTKRANGGMTSVASAAANATGQKDILHLLASSGAGSGLEQEDDSLTPWHYDPPLVLDRAPPTLFRLIDESRDHPGAGSFYIDSGLTEHEIETFLAIWEKLPRDPYSDIYQLYKGEVERSYFWDCTGWVRKVLSRLIERVVSGGGLEGTVLGAGEALPYLRMLHYKSVGANVGPHVDVAKKEALPRSGSTKKRSSRLTFLLYLSGEDQDDAGGETLLLEREEPDSPLMARVKPKRGRLLVFPHSCPHASSVVLQPPKILIRGEFL